MIRYTSFALTALLVFSGTVFVAHSADAQNRRSGVSFSGQRADRIEQKQVPIRRADMGGTSRLQDQRFGIEDWRKQFSPLGQRRAGMDASQQSRLSQRRFDTEVVTMPEQVYGMARHNQRMAELRERAHVDTDDRAWRFERAPRSMIDLQNVKHFTDEVKEADLNDINRFQFRRNRSEGIPAEAAGRG
jgi:hypothetical protein